MRYLSSWAVLLGSAAICWGQQLEIKRPAATWEISEENRCTALRVITGESPAVDVHVVHSRLAEQDWADRVGVAEFELLLEKPLYGAIRPVAANYRLAPTDLPANSSTEIWLCASSSFSRHGVYSGEVAIAASNYPRLAAVPITMLATSPSRRVFGVLIILTGVFIVWLARHYAAISVARTPEMLPLFIQVQRLKEMRHELACAGFTPHMPRTIARIDALIMRTRLYKLDDIASGARMPSPNPLHHVSIGLSRLERETDALSAIVWSGALPMLVAPAHEGAVRGALYRLDALNSAMLTASDIRTRAHEVRSALDATSEEADEVPIRENQSRTIGAFRNIRNPQTGWVVLALIAVTSGWLTLINTHSGFGSAQDLVICFLWGSGGATLLSAVGFERLLRLFDLRPVYPARTSAKQQLLA
jgi:hypothetical protein